MKSFALTAGLLALTTTVSFASSNNAHWGYTGEHGPEHWQHLSNEFSTCGKGQEQSPVNLLSKDQMSASSLKISYDSTDSVIINNGHTIQVNPNKAGSISLNGETFELLQFHFHTPSENTVDDKAYPMEMHLVHKNSKGELAVIGVFIQAGADNDIINSLWNNMPAKAGEKQTYQNKFDVSALLPKDPSFYSFRGSLTTPPCSEGVNWIVMRQPIELSAQQIFKFHTVVGDNARPVQPLNKRIISAAK